MSTLPQVRKNHINLMTRTAETISHLLHGVSQETATTNRDLNDGDKGWTTLEVLCHLHDFDGYFRGRAEMMRVQDHPDLPAYDHEAIAIESAYNKQELSTMLAKFCTSRQQTIAFFQNLSDEEWQRAGNHPERDSFTMTDAVMQVGLHDVGHLEQMMRIIKQIE